MGKNGELDESFPTVYDTQVKLMKSEYRYNSSGMYIDKKDDVVVFLNTVFWVVIWLLLYKAWKFIAETWNIL